MSRLSVRNRSPDHDDQAEPRTQGAGPSFTITVDGEELIVTEHQLTPATIMERAGIEPATHYLVIIEGGHRESLEGKADQLEGARSVSPRAMVGRWRRGRTG